MRYRMIPWITCLIINPYILSEYARRSLCPQSVHSFVSLKCYRVLYVMKSDVMSTDLRCVTLPLVVYIVCVSPLHDCVIDTCALPLTWQSRHSGLSSVALCALLSLIARPAVHAGHSGHTRGTAGARHTAAWRHAVTTVWTREHTRSLDSHLLVYRFFSQFCCRFCSPGPVWLYIVLPVLFCAWSSVSCCLPPAHVQTTDIVINQQLTT